MKEKHFFEHLSIFFDEDNENDSAEVPAFVYKNKKGKVEEIRIFNPKYDEFFYINRNKEFGFINIVEDE